jgi:hypothetical protein
MYGMCYATCYGVVFKHAGTVTPFDHLLPGRTIPDDVVTVRFTERAYLQPGYSVGAAPQSVVPPIVLKFVGLRAR